VSCNKSLRPAISHCVLQQVIASCNKSLRPATSHCAPQQVIASCNSSLRATTTHCVLQQVISCCNDSLRAAMTHCKLQQVIVDSKMLTLINLVLLGYVFDIALNVAASYIFRRKPSCVFYVERRIVFLFLSTPSVF
jgi:hypothetical protein